MTTEELQRWVGMSGHYGIHINGKVISDIAAELIAARAKLAAAERLVEALMPFSEAAEECDDYDHDDQQQAPVDAGQCRAARKAVAAWEDAK